MRAGVRGRDIVIGPSVPRRGGRVSRAIVLWLHERAGWRFEGHIPDVSRFVLIGGPHTSNWDFVLAMAVVFGLGLKCRWIGKHTIFRGPMAPILRWAGGIPVNRSRPGRLVPDVVEQFAHHDAFVVGLSPEGTRSKVSQWKTGFHRIAAGAGVPVLPTYIDAARKVVGFGPLFQVTDDRDADIRKLQAFYARFTPVRPENS